MWNKTTYFLLPVLKLDGRDLARFNLVNAYLDDEGIEREGYNLFLLFKYPTNNGEVSSDYLRYTERLRGRADYVGDYSPEKGHTMFVFEFPEEFSYEFEVFKEGKYSKFRLKEFCDRFYSPTDSMYRICVRDKEWWNRNWGKELSANDTPLPPPDGEFHSKPNMKEEIYRYGDRV